MGEVWCIVFTGTETCWPVKTMLGGKPANIRGKIVRLADSSHAMLAAGGHNDASDERTKAIFLANHTRSMMQELVEELLPLDGAADGSTGTTTLENSSAPAPALIRRDRD